MPATAERQHKNGYAKPTGPPETSSWPHDEEAEKWVIGSMLRYAGCIPDVAVMLKKGHFFKAAHQAIAEAIFAINDRGKPVDLVTVADVMKRNGTLEDAGGYSGLAKIFDNHVTAANVEHYARIVWEHAVARSLIVAGEAIADEGRHRTGSAEEMLEKAEKTLFRIAETGIAGETVDLSTCVSESYDRIDARHERKAGSVSGLATGYYDLDDKTAGLQNGELVILAARPSQGKTALALALARNISILNGEPILFVSLEQSRVELADRLMCCQAKVDMHQLRSGRLGSGEMQKLIEAGGALRSAPFLIDDAAGQGMGRIAANARRWRLKKGIKLVVVDYLQLVAPDDHRSPRQEQVAGISRRLKHLARELNVPVLALAQLNRGLEDRQGHIPRLSDLRESGSIEADADTVILLHRPDYYDPNEQPGIIELHLSKQRNGPTGKVTLTFEKQYQRFENWAPMPGAF